jgi:hypothetical protein
VEIAGTFSAVPLGAAQPPASAFGEWDCKAGDDLPFALTIQRDGRVHGSILGQGIENGLYRDGTLRFELEDQGVRYHPSATFRDGKLAGGWTEDGGGSFVCARAATKAALVTLYEADGLYTTHSNLGAKPVARVWRNPAAKLMLDPDAGPPAPEMRRIR